jgi:hypothetical protein
MDHVIKVSLDEGEVRADPNPLPNLRPGDTVTWLLPAGLDESDLRVEFQEIRPLSADDAPARRRRCGRNGPFATLTREPGRIFGRVPRRRYIYKFFQGDEQIQWGEGNRLPGDENFGGLDDPQPPPRGG